MLNASAYRIIEPSFQEPEILMQWSQASGYVDTLEGGALRTRLGEDDLLVYVKQLNIRTKTASSQSTYNELPGVDISAQMISTMTYMVRVRSEYDHHDVAAGARLGFAVPEAYRLGMRQANFQLARDAALHGMNPQNGEGFLNAPGAVSVNLPPDQFGNTTVVSYDNGQMAFFLSQAVQLMKTRTLQNGIGRKFCFLGPQRTLASFQYNIVQLVQMQRTGAGSLSTVGTLKQILMDNGDEMTWAYDDTLQGAGASSNVDIVILAMPEIEVPVGPSPVNTNVFAGLLPNNKTCTTQYCDMAAPREIISPLPGGATDMLMEWRFSSGWALRGLALTLISMTYQ